jgi:preprotein translocase subunit SecY
MRATSLLPDLRINGLRDVVSYAALKRWVYFAMAGVGVFFFCLVWCAIFFGETSGAKQQV